jgi:hypothetical protein
LIFFLVLFSHSFSHSTVTNATRLTATFLLSVVVRSCEKWNSEERRHVPYPASLLSQMVGLAGVVVGTSNQRNQRNQRNQSTSLLYLVVVLVV